MMDESEDATEHQELEQHVSLVEAIDIEIDSEGNLIVDDSVFVVDGHGEVIAKDETITFRTPTGDVIVSELGDDGEMHITQP